MNKDDKITKEIFETLIKYTNLTPDAIDDLYYLQGYITNLQQENKRLSNVINELDEMFYETFRISQNGYFSISEWELKEFTDKLKELKEGKE